MKVEILTFDDEAVPRITATWSLNAEGLAVCDAPLLAALEEKHGIVGPKGPVFPAAGKDFLALLPQAYSGSRVRARILP